jgi:predicted RNA-binding protein with PIN domain
MATHVHTPRAPKKQLPLLVVDGYNVIYGTTYYQQLIDEHAGAGALADVAHLSRDPYGHDPFERAREALVSDVAAYAQGSYEPVIVFDAAGNLSDERPVTRRAGVRMVFSATGESADAVIERLASRARHAGRDVLLVTSDNTIRFTVGGVPITTVSSQLLARNLAHTSADIQLAREERSHAHMTVESRLNPETRAKLNQLLGR